LVFEDKGQRNHGDEEKSGGKELEADAGQVSFPVEPGTKIRITRCWEQIVDGKVP
jgi:hypothetical protein